MYLLSDYNYKLHEELIAQQPVLQRDRSRLLVLDRKSGDLIHRQFYELNELLSPSDVLVINDTEVIPGRIFGNKDTGGKVEILLLNYTGSAADNMPKENKLYRCLIKASKKPKQGSLLHFSHGLKAEVINYKDGISTLKFICDTDFETILYRIGNVPLPPYIKRGKADKCLNDSISYQTVYASQKGAIAAPTAGLHFTDLLLDKIKSKGVKIVPITLHVGYGTFLPVRVDDIRRHKMHSETYFISESSTETLNRAKKNGGRIVAVGTTCVRTLEYASDDQGIVQSGGGACDLFIYPGYKFKMIDAVVTNFHLPESTLIMLVSAFAGRKNILTAYVKAIKNNYRFYSYGDAMFII